MKNLLELNYYIYPFSFSFPCTVALVEYFYCQINYGECLNLIHRFIQHWWSYSSSREKLELAKLKCLSLIIELKEGALESAILSGYFAKRVLTGHHESVFLIETSIHLTLALIYEMRISHIQLILEHLEYLSEQTMNFEAKLWYYVLSIDASMELGCEFLPMSIDFLDQIGKYRQKLTSKSNQQTLLLIYTDCVLSEIYIRLGHSYESKIHFNQVLYQIKRDRIHLSNIDLRFKRVLLKLIEIQLLHFYHDQPESNRELFLVHHLNEEFHSLNKSRFFIYQAYYDRLINDYRRKDQLPIDVSQIETKEKIAKIFF